MAERDIVEEARGDIEIMRASVGPMPGREYRGLADLMEKLADAVEELRAEVEQMREDARETESRGWPASAYAAVSENEVLRARLRASTPEGSETETEHSPGYVIMAHYRRADGEWWWEPKAWKRYRDDADRFAGALKAYRTHTGAEVTHHVFPLSPPSHDVEALREALDWLENTVTKVRSDESAEAFGKAEGILFAVAYIRRSTHVGDEG